LKSASEHYPFAPALNYGDRAANKTLDIAQERWPYPFESKPEQVWNDVRSVADTRVVQPAYGVAKSVDQSLTPLVDSFSFVVKKIDADADAKARATDDYQLQRAYALLLVLKDDILRTANDDQNAVVKNIHATLTRLTNQSSALLAAVRSRSEDAATRANVLAHAVLAELDKLSPLVSALTSNTSTTLKDTSTNLRAILSSDDPLGQKIPKVGAAVQGGVREVVEDVVEKVHELVEDIRSSSSSASSGSSSTSPSTSNDDSAPSDPKPAKRGKRGKKAAQVNGNGTAASNSAPDST